jgi:hypothetical protein
VLTHSPDPERRANQSREGWSAIETKALCALYAHMLELEAHGLLGRSKAAGQTSKATLVRSFILEAAPNRSKGSVEAKLMNLSAARAVLGLPLVTGYKALPNMSAECMEIAREYWGAR